MVECPGNRSLTAATESDDDIDIVLVNGDKHQSSPVKANSEQESQDTPLRIINEWYDQQGHGDFVQHFDEAIRTQKLQLGNLSFRLFAEYLRSIVLPDFRYDDQTLMWWICGFKMFGSRWLRSMKGTPHKPNFATPSIPLFRLCVEPMSSTGVIGSDVPWLECPACNALTWVIAVTE